MPKKVLIIAYYWPPAGGPGVQRWLKFVKYFPDFDIDPIVYIPENPNYPIIDESMVAEIPSDVTILRQPIKEPYKLAALFSKQKTKTISKGIISNKERQSLIERLLLFIRGNFFIPDARKSWVNPSVSYLKKYIVDHKVDTIITTGPPHSLHLIGLKLNQLLNIRWLADFRDPWTTIGYHKRLKLLPFAKAKHKALESKVLNESDHIVVTSNHTKTEFASKTDTSISVITNGFDRIGVERPKKDTKFTMSHIGSLLSERNPTILWKVLSELINEDEAFKEAFQLNLFGVTSDDVIRSIEQHGLGNFVINHGYVSHDNALVAQMGSQILLLIEIDSEDTKAIIPGKLFEYLASGTPILALGPKDSDVERIVKTTNTGSYFTYDSYSELKKQILLYFEAYKANSLQVNAIGVEQYSRKSLTKQLANIILQA
ncbi:glycosyltransferase [Winogradskyella sp. 3972H.M.0a.05]|uniref:glycosyltransferase n=1 Tax=Winogradskyella sp. 3972H.M.0a.05 TaxID=2950277 RepID=UPI0033958030